MELSLSLLARIYWQPHAAGFEDEYYDLRGLTPEAQMGLPVDESSGRNYYFFLGLDLFFFFFPFLLLFRKRNLKVLKTPERIAGDWICSFLVSVSVSVCLLVSFIY
jgi:hypothetical protein